MNDPNRDRHAALKTVLEITDAALEAHPEEIENIVNLLYSYVRGSQDQRDDLLRLALAQFDERQDGEVTRQMLVARRQLLSDDERKRLDLTILAARDSKDLN